MGIGDMRRLKDLEAANADLQARLAKLEAHVFGVEADEDLNDIDVPEPKRRPGRPRKDAA
jgi:hypothetical protein